MPTSSNPVLTMLKADHKKVKALFTEYHQATPGTQKELAQTTMKELEIHAGIEEELIYPAIRKGTKDDKLMNFAIEEHHLMHVLIAEIRKLEPSDGRFKAKFTVLGELVKHHVKEEEGEMFLQAQNAKIDWEALEVDVIERKEQLRAKS